jgi:hypothetical protein
MNSATTGHRTIDAQKSPERAAEHLVAVLDELISIIVEENAMLARGLPASISILTKRKCELADELEQWVRDVATKTLDIRSCRGTIRTTYMERVRTLRAVMDENVERLRTAIDASRRRIDAVMQAIRREVAPTSSYSADGRACSKPASKSVCGVIVSV